MVKFVLLLTVLLGSSLWAGKAMIPINIGVGPAAYFITHKIRSDQEIHYGTRLHIKAIIDKKVIESQKDKIPAKFRKLVSKIGEARIGLLYVPESLFISPQINNTGIYGATWKPIAISIPLLKSPSFKISLGLIGTYAYISSTTLPSPTHFLRPGLDLKSELEFPIAENALISAGWASAFYPPQKVGGSIFGFGARTESIWHIGQAFLMLHLRIPHEANL